MRSPVDKMQLSMFQPRKVKRGSKCWPTVSGTNARDLESNCEFSIENLSVCLSKGKLSMRHESFIIHWSFICMYISSPDVSIVAKAFSTDLSIGISRFLSKSNFLFLYFSQSHS